MIISDPMSKPRGAKSQSQNRFPKRGHTPVGGPHGSGFTAGPLRREAERGWEESDRSAAKGIQRRGDKARAHKLRRQTSRHKDELIARLRKRIAHLEEELAKYLH